MYLICIYGIRLMDKNYIHIKVVDKEVLMNTCRVNIVWIIIYRSWDMTIAVPEQWRTFNFSPVEPSRDVKIQLNAESLQFFNQDISNSSRFSTS